MGYTVVIMTMVLLGTGIPTSGQDLAVPTATNLEQGAYNYLDFPFNVRGGLDDNGYWEMGNSTVRGRLFLSYRLPDQPGGYVKKMEKTVPVGVGGLWQMFRFELRPPDNAYQISYLFDIFHFHKGKISVGRSYTIIPTDSSLKKYGILKLAERPKPYKAPIPYGELKKMDGTFEKDNGNPPPIAPNNNMKIKVTQ